MTADPRIEALAADPDVLPLWPMIVATGSVDGAMPPLASAFHEACSVHGLDGLSTRDILERLREHRRRLNDCKVCGEPEHAPCFVDVHEEAARVDERKRIAAWVRENCGINGVNALANTIERGDASNV
jgi:hypothetical protein